MVVRVVGLYLTVVDLDQAQHGRFGCGSLQAAAGEALTKFNPAGRLSVTDKLAASDGPKFVTAIV